MEAKLSQTLPFSAWMDSEKMVRNPIISLQLPPRHNRGNRLQSSLYGHLPPTRTTSWLKPKTTKVSCSQKKYSGSASKPAVFPASLDEATILKNKSDEIEPYLDGRCIYLVGMMGSGKTTVGRILSEVLGYSFYDSDALIEQAVGRTSVAEIFRLHGEGFFRENETEVLRKLSHMHRLVISTGGGAVIRPINWKYMHKGVSVWLDVPLEALARRISDIGTESRPLLHQESGDAYTKALTRLTTLMKERGDAYPNANVRVSLENIAAKLGYMDVCNLTPTVIVIEVLDQLKSYLEKEGNGSVV